MLRHLQLDTVVTGTIADALVHAREEPLLVVVDTSLGDTTALFASPIEERPATLALADGVRGATSFEAFACGADQVVRLPFTPDELAVRAAALLRRLGHHPTFAHTQAVHGFGLSLDEQVHLGPETVRLTPHLNSLLYLFAANAGRTVTNDEIARLTWGMERSTSGAAIASAVAELGRSLGERSNSYFTLKAEPDGASMTVQRR